MLQSLNPVLQICVAGEKKDASLVEKDVSLVEKDVSLANLKEEEKEDLADVANLDHEEEETDVIDLNVLVEDKEEEHTVNLEAMYQIHLATRPLIHLEVCHGLLVP